MKRLNAEAEKTENEQLRPWVRHIANHLFKSAELANGEPMRLISIFRGVLHHVVDKHEWLSGDGAGFGQCLHGPLDDDPDRPAYLIAGSVPHKNLAALVYNKTWLKTTAQTLCNFRLVK